MSDAARECPHLQTCPMFQHFKLQASLEIWKLRYCLAAYRDCERHKRSSLGMTIPANLMPSGALLRRVNP